MSDEKKFIKFVVSMMCLVLLAGGITYFASSIVMMLADIAVNNPTKSAIVSIIIGSIGLAILTKERHEN